MFLVERRANFWAEEKNLVGCFLQDEKFIIKHEKNERFACGKCSPSPIDPFFKLIMSRKSDWDSSESFQAKQLGFKSKYEPEKWQYIKKTKKKNHVYTRVYLKYKQTVNDRPLDLAKLQISGKGRNKSYDQFKYFFLR